MILRLALSELRHRPGRLAFLLGGYTLGVAVMVVLLAVGEAMLEQARDRELVGGGDLVIVPAGITPEMLKAGGAPSLFLGIGHARFLQRNALESPRGREEMGIVSASPLLEGRPVEVHGGGGLRVTALATGEIPSRARAAGAFPRLLAGRWEDSNASRRWTSPTPAELLREIDPFHRPPVRDSTWAEWHYFNVVLDDERWLYLTLMVAGEVGTPGRWGGRILLTFRDADGTHRSRTRDLPGEEVRFDTTGPDLRFGERAFVRLVDSTYHVVVDAGELRADLRFAPAPHRYFPPTDLGGAELLSGYVVPSLYAAAEGTVCLPRCEPVRRAQGYHDHNWGVWREVWWEWGSASNADLSLLYGVVRGSEEGPAGLFAYLSDGAGVRAVFRPRDPVWTDTTEAAVEGSGERVRVPRAFRFEDPRAGIAVDVEVSAAHATRLERAGRRHFVQMRGVATVRERDRVLGRLPGFFETYVD